MYKDLKKRRLYIKNWRAQRILKGFYGQCKGCGNNLGRNDGIKGRHSNGYCKKCNRGNVNQNWKGGHLNHDGYRVIRNSNSKPVLEHRLIMEHKLGRPLLPNETIHHKNGVRTDNRIENLEVWVGAPIRGLRVEDAVSWAKQILKNYE